MQTILKDSVYAMTTAVTLAFTLFSNQAISATCDPGFTTDSGAFALEGVEDFENTGYPINSIFGINNTYVTPVAPTLDLPGIVVMEDPDEYQINFQIRENCGSAIPMVTTYVEVFGPIEVHPKGQVSKLGFNYAHQDLGYGATVEVLDSNGVLHSCQPVSTAVTVQCSYTYGGVTYEYPNTGSGGFIGFNTNDPNVSIVSMRIYQPDGGIDNIRCQGCDGILVSSCSAESLQSDIEALSLQKGVENSLLAKLNAAVATKKSGVVNSAIGVYGALKNEISAKSPDPISETDASNLLSCIDELISDLQASQ